MVAITGTSFWSIGLYVTPLEEEFGWSRTLLQTGIAVSLLVSGIASPLAGRLIDRRGPRFAIIFGTVLTCASFVLLATTSSIVEWYLYFSINAFFRGFMFYIPFQVLMSRWFVRKRGRAVGILAMGFSGGVVLVPVMQQIIDHVSWEMSFIFAAVVLAATFLPVALFVVRDHPAQMGLDPDGDPRPLTNTAGADVQVGLTVRQTLKTLNFWVIALAFVAIFFGQFGWILNGVPVYESFGISREAIAVLVLGQGACGLISRPTFGYLAERFPSIELASVVLAGVLALGMAVLLVTGGSWLGIGLFMACWLVGSAGGPILEALILPRVFGLKHLGAIMGTMFMLDTIGQFLVPIASGAIYDARQSYDLYLLALIGALAAAMLMFTLAHFIPNPRIPSPRAALAAAVDLMARRASQHLLPHEGGVGEATRD